MQPKKQPKPEKNPVGRPLKFKTVSILENKINTYFKMCEEKKKPLTITGLALALDTSRQTLLEYEGEVEGRKKDREYVDTIKKAKTMCENFADEFLFSGKQVAGAIFNLKNNYGWVDKSETELTTPQGIKIEVIKKYDSAKDGVVS